MSLREKQEVFALNMAKLYIWIFSNPGWTATKGEALRTEDQQILYFEGKTIDKTGAELHLVSAPKRSKTKKSGHLLKLAEDVNLFIDGVYQTKTEAYKPLAEYWKSLHPDNIAGYDWGWDGNHFEMK